MPMNDPHVEAIHYYIKHDNSVDYSDVKPLVHDDAPLFRIRAEKRKVVLEPKCHYATAEEAKGAAEGFVRRWEFEAALRTQSDAFRLVYEGAHIVDRDPPPGSVNAGPSFWSFDVSEPQVTVTKRRVTYPELPLDPAIDPDDRDASDMLSLLDRYRLRRARLADVAYFCLTVLECSAVRAANDNKCKRQKAVAYYQIERDVLDKVGTLSSEKGGPDDARKDIGRSHPFTEEERSFLEAAVTAFIRRAAEKAAKPNRNLPCVTMVDLPN